VLIVIPDISVKDMKPPHRKIKSIQVMNKAHGDNHPEGQWQQNALAKGIITAELLDVRITRALLTMLPHNSIKPLRIQILILQAKIIKNSLRRPVGQKLGKLIGKGVNISFIEMSEVLILVMNTVSKKSESQKIPTTIQMVFRKPPANSVKL
jgi:hypothetical protein